MCGRRVRRSAFVHAVRHKRRLTRFIPVRKGARKAEEETMFKKSILPVVMAALLAAAPMRRGLYAGRWVVVSGTGVMGGTK